MRVHILFYDFIEEMDTIIFDFVRCWTDCNLFLGRKLQFYNRQAAFGQLFSEKITFPRDCQRSVGWDVCMCVGEGVCLA